jgi:hypothetical protein
MASLTSGRFAAFFVVGLSAVVACSSSTPPATASAKITGQGLATVKSAALIASGTITPDSGRIGALNTYVQFLANQPGDACSALDAASVDLVGSLSVPGDPTTFHGRALQFGVTPDLFLTFNAAGGSSGGDVDGGGGETPSYVAVSGTVTMSDSNGALTGTIDAQMVLGSDPGGTLVPVTGSFTAPSCGTD